MTRRILASMPMRSRRRTYATVFDGTGKLDLGALDPGDTAGLQKDEASSQLEALGREFGALSNLLAFSRQHALLVVFQGRDASGKDGVIRKVLEYGNVLNAQVHAFKVPTEQELAHDFLWRIHGVTPRSGDLVLFNRSHYEDVIAARVHQLVPRKIWKARYDYINAFERLLLDSRTIVVKFFLHVSRAEQIERLKEREADPRTAWKLAVADWRELPLWDETTAAYEEAMKRCSSPRLPFHLVPADHKWFRNLAVLERLVLALRPHREGWMRALEDMRGPALKEIHQIRKDLRLDSVKTHRRDPS